MKKILIILLLLPVISKCQNITTIAGNGSPGYSGDNNSAIMAKFDRPLNVKFDHSGNMYVVDVNNNVIRKINSAGIITTVVGNGTQGYSGDGGQAATAELYGPQDIAFDATGNLYISEAGNMVIRKVNTSGIITTIAGGGTSGLGDGGSATAAQLSDPFGLIFDNLGNLYFSDGGTYRVRKINTSGIISTIAGTGIAGNSGNNGPATIAQLKLPGYLAISSSGDIYIPDWENHCVRKVNSAGIISTVAGNGINGDNGDGLPATAAAISSPETIVFDNSGNFYISNYTTCIIRKVNTSGIISTVVGNGTCGYTGDNTPATSAEIQTEAICSYIDASGNLYIADSKNNRIRKVTYNNTAVNEIKNTLQNIEIYPNPAHNEITISAGNKIENVEVISLIGQEVYYQHYSSNTATININGYANGIYFVKVNGVYAGRFVKE